MNKNEIEITEPIRDKEYWKEYWYGINKKLNEQRVIRENAGLGTFIYIDNGNNVEEIEK